MNMEVQIDDKKRVANWTIQEKAILLDQYEKYHHELFGRIKSSEFKRKRDERWRQVADAVSRVGAGRTTQQCHKKLENIISQTKTKNRLQKHTPTGGGLRDSDFNTEETVIIRAIGDTPTMNGILPSTAETVVSEAVPGSICFSLSNDNYGVVQDLMAMIPSVLQQDQQQPEQQQQQPEQQQQHQEQQHQEQQQENNKKKRQSTESIEQLRKAALREEIELIALQKKFWTNAIDLLDNVGKKIKISLPDQEE